MLRTSEVGEAIDIYVNNRLVARGEVIVVEDRLGVTMTEIVKSDRAFVFDNSATIEAVPAPRLVFRKTNVTTLRPGHIAADPQFKVFPPTPDWVKVAMGLSVYAVPLMLIGMVLFFYGRARDRERELEATTGRSRWRVRREYLAAERERMRALEDAILDPPDQRFST